MGLDISTVDSEGSRQDEVWSGGYMLFMRFRMSFLSALGGSFAHHADPSFDLNLWYWDDDLWGGLCNYPGIRHFFNHSDCDGDSSREECRSMSKDFAEFLVKCPELSIVEGSFSRDRSNIKQVLERFIDLCINCEGLEWH